MGDARRTIEILLAGRDVGLGRTLDAGQANVASFADRSVRSISHAGRSILSLQSLIVAGGAAMAAKAIVAPAIEIETARAQFSVLMGDADAARRHIDDLIQFAATTPLELPNLTSASLQLQAVGTAVDQVIPTIRMLGDLAGGDAAKVETLTRAYTKMSAKGRVTLEELNMITEAGIPILAELAQQYNVTTAELFRLIERGQVGFPAITVAMRSMTSEGGRYQGMMARMALTTAGQLSTLRDNWRLLRAQVGAEVLPALNASIQDLLGQIQELSDSGELAKWGQAAGSAINQVRETLGGLGRLLVEHPALVKAMIASYAGIKIVGGLAVSISAVSAALIAYRTSQIAAAGATSTATAAMRAQQAAMATQTLTSAAAGVQSVSSATFLYAQNLGALRVAGVGARSSLSALGAALGTTLPVAILAGVAAFQSMDGAIQQVRQALDDLGNATGDYAKKRSWIGEWAQNWKDFVFGEEEGEKISVAAPTEKDVDRAREKAGKAPEPARAAAPVAVVDPAMTAGKEEDEKLAKFTQELADIERAAALAQRTGDEATVSVWRLVTGMEDVRDLRAFDLGEIGARAMAAGNGDILLGLAVLKKNAERYVKAMQGAAKDVADARAELADWDRDEQAAAAGRRIDAQERAVDAEVAAIDRGAERRRNAVEAAAKKLADTRRRLAQTPDERRDEDREDKDEEREKRRDKRRLAAALDRLRSGRRPSVRGQLLVDEYRARRELKDAEKQEREAQARNEALAENRQGLEGKREADRVAREDAQRKRDRAEIERRARGERPTTPENLVPPGGALPAPRPAPAPVPARPVVPAGRRDALPPPPQILAYRPEPRQVPPPPPVLAERSEPRQVPPPPPVLAERSEPRQVPPPPPVLAERSEPRQVSRPAAQRPDADQWVQVLPPVEREFRRPPDVVRMPPPAPYREPAPGASGGSGQTERLTQVLAQIERNTARTAAKVDKMAGLTSS